MQKAFVLNEGRKLDFDVIVFNDKPVASVPKFASACGLPLNEISFNKGKSTKTLGLRVS
jgi:hypothetical protein